MASSSTDRAKADGEQQAGALGSVSVPPALAPRRLAGVPGVLGVIARERAGDYADVALPGRLEPAAPGTAFGQALKTSGIAVIAEIKRSSPSRGLIREVDPPALARAYERAGAAAISVLTESRHFGGSLDHLRSAADTVSVPLLRKDFVVHPLQLVEARAAGASAVLLIAAILGEALVEYLTFARCIGLEALVEVHDEAELTLAMAAGSDVVGVNNRDLRSLAVDLALAPRLLGVARERGFEGVLVAESGYAERRQLDALEGLADAVLVGSSLAASNDPEAALATLTARPGAAASRREQDA